MVFSFNYGCLPVVVGGAAAGAYYAGKDERSLKEIAKDAAISTSVKAGLIKSKNVSATKINVDTYRAVVVLSGRVSSEEEKNLASEIALSVDGVKSVKNVLAIVP